MPRRVRIEEDVAIALSRLESLGFIREGKPGTWELTEVGKLRGAAILGRPSRRRRR